MRSEENDRAGQTPSEETPDFGYDSKAVNAWVQTFGIPASTARNHTKDTIDQVKARLRTSCEALLQAGVSVRKAAEKLGVGKKVIETCYAEIKAAVPKCPEDEMGHESGLPFKPETFSSPFPADEPFFNNHLSTP